MPNNHNKRSPTKLLPDSVFVLFIFVLCLVPNVINVSCVHTQFSLVVSVLYILSYYYLYVLSHCFGVRYDFRKQNYVRFVVISDVWFICLHNVLHDTFNNVSVLLVEETAEYPEKPPTYRKSMTNFITYCCNEYIWTRTGLVLTTLVVIGTDCTGSCISNYHMITTTTGSQLFCSRVHVLL
jgi:hypothetical protein